METVHFSGPTFNQREPIPGYKVLERIGAGGYGEVWKSDAPGGLFKAIKFIYGNLSDTRAARELKSLNRIKEVHHPFLLSLERIEVIDGRLVIVTELADGSLKDRFDECLQEGLEGIPRDELLVYIRDTADALDYIYDNHSLQHLDVKPENLLLLGKRIKVADFGLLKDLHESSASMIGGMTPTYAPPELFDGKPNRHSDQYSLAIVYQEMLTGKPPFDGTTTAQLASQHIHAAPILSPLPKADQPVIGKALSKNPEKRFPNCRSMVECLINPQRVVASTVTSRPRIAESNRLRQRIHNDTTASLPVPSGAMSRRGSSSGKLPTPLATPPRKIVDLPPLQLDGTSPSFRPVLFLGLGGAAARTLRGLRQRLEDRFGDVSQLPAIQMLLVDTDVQDLGDQIRPNEGAGIPEQDTVAIPLRTPKDYRTDSKRLLESISRRWIYNIPRTLQTEGLRPLGRLALVDHFDRVFSRLQTAISTVTDTLSVKKTTKRSGIPFQAGVSPRIYVISSITGGTGSGIALDLTYAARQILLDLGLSDDEVCGVFTYSTQRKAKARDLAVANAYSFLRELHHFGQPGNIYPGDANCGILAFDEHHCPFLDTYLIHLGEELDNHEYEAGADQVAEYLYRDTLTAASTFFRSCREQEHAEVPLPLSQRRLRTFCIQRLGGAIDRLPADEEKRVCLGLLKQWLGHTLVEPPPPQVRLSEVRSMVSATQAANICQQDDRRVLARCAEFAAQQQLDVEHLIQVATKSLEQETECDRETHLDRLVREAHARAEHAELDRPTKLSLDTIAAVLGCIQPDDGNSTFESLATVLRSKLEPHAATQSAAIREWVIGLFNGSPMPVKDATAALKWFADELSTLADVASSLGDQARQQADTMRETVLQADVAIGKGKPGRKASEEAPKGVVEQVLPLARLQCNQVLYAVVHGMLVDLRRRTTELARELQSVEHVISSWLRNFDVPTVCQDPTVETIIEELDRRRPQLVTALHEQLTNAFASGGSLYRTFHQEPEARQSFFKAMRSAARFIAMHAVQQANVADLQRRLKSSDPQQRLEADQCWQLVQPPLLRCGGECRRLLLVPEGPVGDELGPLIQAGSETQATLIRNVEHDVLLCCEVQNVPLDSVAAHLINGRHHCVAIAQRLRSRVDVQFSAI